VRSFEAMEDYHALVADTETRKVALRRIQSRESVGRARSVSSGLRRMQSAEDLYGGAGEGSYGEGSYEEGSYGQVLVGEASME
jgi:hypothetical protein